MLGTYRDVLTVPGAAAFSAAGALARLPMSMLGIGIVLLVRASTGSYALAGSVAGAFELTLAVASPWLARAVDAYGQARVMLPALVAHVGGLGLLLVCARPAAPRWSIYLAALIAGASMGSLGSLVRARWSHVLAGHDREQALLHTAYSWESVLDELAYVVGPPLITLLATRISPTVGLLAAMLAVGVGGGWLLALSGSAPAAAGARPGGGQNLLRQPGLVVLLLAMACAGAIFGSVEVLTVAFSDEQRALGATGWVLAAFALGSLLAGLGYGAVHWRQGSGTRFQLAVLLLAAGVVPVLLVRNLAALAAVVFVAGFAISPMLISGNGLVQELVPAARLTEGLTWVSSAIGIGVSAGAAIAGAEVDAVGARRGFAVTVCAAALAVLVVLVGARWLKPAARPRRMARSGG